MDVGLVFDTTSGGSAGVAPAARGTTGDITASGLGLRSVPSDGHWEHALRAILMCINITVVGRMMRRSWTFANRAGAASEDLPVSPLSEGGEDTSW